MSWLAWLNRCPDSQPDKIHQQSVLLLDVSTQVRQWKMAATSSTGESCSALIDIAWFLMNAEFQRAKRCIAGMTLSTMFRRNGLRVNIDI